MKWPLKITLNEINVAKSYTAEFQFDVGSNPQPGQKWDLNLPIQLGNFQYVLDSVEAFENGYLFKYHSGKDVPEGTSPAFDIVGYPPEEYHSELRNKGTVVVYSERLVFSLPLPTGKLTVKLNNMEEVPLQGPWTLIWTPPSP